MAITRKKKEELVALYKELIENTPAMVFTNYQGTTVAQVKSLRAKLKDSNTTYAVVKNTLFELALRESGRVAPEELLNGANAVAFCGEDIGKSVTALKAWIKDAKVVEITGAILENSVLDSKNADALSDLRRTQRTGPPVGADCQRTGRQPGACHERPRRETTGSRLILARATVALSVARRVLQRIDSLTILFLSGG